MMPMSSTILSYSPALRSGIVPAGRMPFSTMASIARAGFASSNSKSQGWAKYSALGLLFLNGDDETNNKPVDLRVRRAPKELRNKSHKIAGGFKKSTASSSNGLVRSSVQMRAALSRASFKEIMRQIQISRSSNVALTISLYGYNVWDLEGA